MSEDGESNNNDLPLDPVVLVLGWTTVRVVWDYIQRPITLIAWFILCIAPRWKPTFTTVTLIPPFVHSLLYTSVLLLSIVLLNPKPNPAVVDIYNMDSIQAIFAVPNISFCGSIHYLAFDLLVARGIALDAVQTCRVSYIKYYVLVVPCLLATFCVGPVGYLCYVLLRLTQIIAPPPVAAATDDHKESWEEGNVSLVLRTSSAVDDGDSPISNAGDDEDNDCVNYDYNHHDSGNNNEEEEEDDVVNAHHETPASYNESENDCDTPIGNNRRDGDETGVPHPAPPKDDCNYEDGDEQENEKHEKKNVDNEESKEENHRNAMLEEEERFLQAVDDPIIQDVNTDNILFPLPNWRPPSMSSSTASKRPDTYHGIPNVLKKGDDFRESDNFRESDDFQDDFLHTEKTAADGAIADAAHVVPTFPKVSAIGHRQGQQRKSKLQGIDALASVGAMHRRWKPRTSLNEEIESPVNVALRRQGQSPCNHRSSSWREVLSSSKEIYQHSNLDRFHPPGEVGREWRDTESMNQTKNKQHNRNETKRKSTGSLQDSDRQGNKRVCIPSQHCDATNNVLVNAKSFEDRVISRATHTFPSSSVADSDDVVEVHDPSDCGDGQSTVATMKSSKLQCQPITPSNQSTTSYDHISKSPSETIDLHEGKTKSNDVLTVVKAIEADSEIADRPRLQRRESYDLDEHTRFVRSTPRLELGKHASPGRRQLKGRFLPRKAIVGHDDDNVVEVHNPRDRDFGW